MTRALSAAAASLLLASCATSPRPESDRQWLVGTWLMLGNGVEYPVACASGLPRIAASTPMLGRSALSSRPSGSA